MSPEERTPEGIELELCVGRHRYRSSEDAHNAANHDTAGVGWWSCPFCGKYHIGPTLTIEGLADLAWAARALAGNAPGHSMVGPFHDED